MCIISDVMHLTGGIPADKRNGNFFFFYTYIHDLFVCCICFKNIHGYPIFSLQSI